MPEALPPVLPLTMLFLRFILPLPPGFWNNATEGPLFCEMVQLVRLVVELNSLKIAVPGPFPWVVTLPLKVLLVTVRVPNEL